MEEIDKGKEGEDFVNKIAYKSFLKAFCFPNPLDITKDYKEISDLLILFNDICIIISVKNYKFDGNYERYFKKTINKSINQINGAERLLFRDSPIVLLKHPDRHEIAFDKKKYKKVFRLIVNINSEVKFYPTSIQINNKNFAVFDSLAWENAITILDTIPDFIQFLERRIELFDNKPGIIFPREEDDFSDSDRVYAIKIINDLIEGSTPRFNIILGSEQDLIAEYILSGYDFSDKIKNVEVDTKFLKLDGRWDQLNQYEEFSKAKLSYKHSYLIDSLVKEMIIDKKGGEFLSEILYSMNRLERECLAKNFLEYCEQQREQFKSRDKLKFNRTICKIGKYYIVFMFFDDGYPQKELEFFMMMSMRQCNYLEDFKLLNVGTIAQSQSGNKYLFGYYDAKSDHLNETDKLNFEKDLINLGWKTKL